MAREALCLDRGDDGGNGDGTEPNFDGLLIRKDFNYQILAPRDLSTFTSMKATQIEQTLMIPFRLNCSGSYLCRMTHLEIR